MGTMQEKEILVSKIRNVDEAYVRIQMQGEASRHSRKEGDYMYSARYGVIASATHYILLIPSCSESWITNIETVRLQTPLQDQLELSSTAMPPSNDRYLLQRNHVASARYVVTLGAPPPPKNVKTDVMQG